MATPIWGLPEPSGTDAANTLDTIIDSLSDALDNATQNVTMLRKGVIASRPTAATAKSGCYYLATDTGVLYLSDGTDWIEASTGGGSVPIGTMLDWALAVAPSDTRYLLCAGQAVSRTTYQKLYDSNGGPGATNWPHGQGDGSTTFNLPDTRGRVTVTEDGAAGRLSGSDTVGASGGAQTHVLSTGELASHTHTQTGTFGSTSAGTHSHGGATAAMNANQSHAHSASQDLGAVYNASGFAGSGAISLASGVNFTIYRQNQNISVFSVNIDHLHGIVNDGNHSHSTTISGSTGSAGSGTAHNNMQPYLVVQKIIRVA